MTRYPLTWPTGWRRAFHRASARFSTFERTLSNYREHKQLTVSDSVGRILKSLRMLGVRDDDAIISTNVQVRLDGLPRSNQPAPMDPGAAVYWQTPGTKTHKVMAIDRYDRVADNLAAIAATLEAMRAIERHGGAEILDRAFTGFQALPAPKDWREIMGVNATITLDQVRTRYRKLALERHPDMGGSQVVMAELNQAMARAEAELR